MSSSNNAKPTITDGRHSPNVDSEGNVKSDVPNDVKKHNEEMEHRYDRPYNQLGNEGKPPKGFWERPQAWTSGVVRGDIPYGRVELGKLLYDRLNGTSSEIKRIRKCHLAHYDSWASSYDVDPSAIKFYAPGSCIYP